MESTTPFRHWTRDILVWSIPSPLNVQRKCAAVVLALRGTAAELARGLPAQALLHGGQINGQAADPMTFLMHALSERFSQLGEETRLQAMTELKSFGRRGRERVDDVISGFDTVRERATREGQMMMSIQGLSFILLRACQINDH